MHIGGDVAAISKSKDLDAARRAICGQELTLPLRKVTIPVRSIYGASIDIYRINSVCVCVCGGGAEKQHGIHVTDGSKLDTDTLSMYGWF